MFSFAIIWLGNKLLYPIWRFLRSYLVVSCCWLGERVPMKVCKM